MVMDTSIRRNTSPRVDTSARTEKLDNLKAEKTRELNALRNNRDLTVEARAEKVQELARSYDARIADEAGTVVSKIDAEIERAYRAANPLDKPSGDHAADMAKELRYRRISEDVMEDLADGTDPIRAYDNAVRLGDEERAGIIAKHAPRFLDSVQRRDLYRRVEERLPEKVKDARARLSQLEAERRSLELGLTMQGVNLRRK